MPKNKENLHAGHRQRMREEVMRQNSFNTLADHRLLELLLFSAIPRKDTNEIAHTLLKTFKSVSGVLDAEIHDLAAVKGMTQNAAILIKTILPLAKRYQNNKFKEGHVFNSIDECGDFLIEKYLGYKNETFIVTCLDAAGKLLACEIFEEGFADSVQVSFREIAARVLKHNTQWVIISHNHTVNNALPSETDIKMTIELKQAFEQLNIKLLDHIIVSGDDYVSLRQSAKFASIFK